MRPSIHLAGTGSRTFERMPELAVSAEDEQFAARELPVEQNLHKCFGSVTALAESWAWIPADTGNNGCDLGADERRTALGGVFRHQRRRDELARSPTALKSSGEAREVSVTLTLGNNHCGLRRRTIGIALRGDIPAQPIQPRFRQGSWSEIAK